MQKNGETVRDIIAIYIIYESAETNSMRLQTAYMVQIPTKKPPFKQDGFKSYFCRVLASGNCANRALIHAGTAVNASFRVDFILGVAFGNSIRGANAGTGSTGDTLIGNYVSHSFLQNIVSVIE